MKWTGFKSHYSLLETILDCHLLAIFFSVFTLIGAVEKLAIEQLNTDGSENELKQQIND